MTYNTNVQDPEYLRKDEPETVLLWEHMLKHESDYGPEIVKFMDAARYWYLNLDYIAEFRDMIFKAEKEVINGS